MAREFLCLGTREPGGRSRPGHEPRHHRRPDPSDPQLDHRCPTFQRHVHHRLAYHHPPRAESVLSHASSGVRQMLQRLSDRLDDRGIALHFVAIMLVLLMGMTALAVDLGWLYLNGSRVQRGADAAALAGVVYLPGDLPEVSVQSVNGANANGWNVGSINGNP